MKKSVLAAFVITLIFTSSQLLAWEVHYICWDNNPIPIAKNVVLIKLYPDFRSESEREQVFENIRSEFSDDIEFELLYGFDRHGWVRIRFLYEVNNIRAVILTIEDIEGIESASPSIVGGIKENKETVLSNTPSGTNMLAQQGVFIDPEELDFGNVRQQEVGCRKVTISNAMDTVINAQTWIEGTDSVNFKILDGVSSFEIPPDSSKNLELEFRPDSTRSFEAVLNIDHEARSDQHPKEVQLTGKGWPKATSTDPIEQVADQITLEQNYPNPFNPSTQIQFAIAEPSHVHLAVYNTLGQKISKLVNEPRSPGWHRVDFNASGLSSGIYIYRLETQGRILQRQMTFVK